MTGSVKQSRSCARPRDFDQHSLDAPAEMFSDAKPEVRRNREASQDQTAKSRQQTADHSAVCPARSYSFPSEVMAMNEASDGQASSK
jgi:hypothetical protein